LIPKRKENRRKQLTAGSTSWNNKDDQSKALERVVRETLENRKDSFRGETTERGKGKEKKKLKLPYENS
jgi:hypothetical protein